MGLVALSLLIGPRLIPGPVVSEEPSPTATVAATPTPSETPDAPTPTPTPTPAPTPEPLAQWTGLAWSDPVTPPFTVHLTDLAPWGDDYVAAGWVETDPAAGGAILTSPDGLNWTVAYQTDPASDRWPRQVIVLGDQLFAFTNPNMDTRLAPDARPPIVWRSADGTSWTLVESASWRDAWAGLAVGPMPASRDHTQYDIPTGLVDVAGGPGGIVAIGNSFADNGLIPVILHSTDGQTWSQVRLPGGAVSPLLNEVVTYGGGFVLVGATDVGADPHAAIPAAWFSTDGMSWIRATVNVDETLFPDGPAGHEMGAVAAGADGLVGWRGQREISIGGPRFVGEWTSPDGQTWQPRDANTYPPYYAGDVVGDGARMVAFPNTFHEDSGQWTPIDTAWVSTDAVTWRELALSAEMSDPPEGFWVVPDGVIYAGVQSFWFGAAKVGE
jgi:hypothetical protein